MYNTGERAVRGRRLIVGSAGNGTPLVGHFTDGKLLHNNWLKDAHFVETGHGRFDCRALTRCDVSESYSWTGSRAERCYWDGPDRTWGLAGRQSFGSSYLLHARDLRGPEAGAGL